MFHHGTPPLTDSLCGCIIHKPTATRHAHEIENHIQFKSIAAKSRNVTGIESATFSSLFMDLHIKLLEASDVPSADVLSKSDCYVRISSSTSSQVWQTKVADDTSHPIWNEEFHIPITSSMKDVITLTLMDDDAVTKDDEISSRKFKVTDFQPGKVVDDWWVFEPLKGFDTGGKVRIVFHLSPCGRAAFVEE